MSPLVSVLLPTRDRSRALRHAIHSIQRQSLNDLEILILDDGSKDSTPEVLKNISLLDSRVRWVRRDESRGLADALNTLISMSRGRWLARMDDDDISHPRRLEIQIKWMRDRELDVCGTWYRRRSMLGNSIARPPVDDATIRAELFFQPPLLHPSVMFHRKVIERYGVYSTEYSHAEDYELWVRLAPRVKFGNVPEVLLDYTLSPKQVSRRHNRTQALTARRIRESYLRAMGIRCNEIQRSIHCSLRDPSPIEHIDVLDRIEGWLLTLKSQLAASAAPAIHRQWFLAAVRAAGLGFCVYNRFIVSPMADTIPTSRKTILKLMCLTRLRYRSLVYSWLEPLSCIG